MLLVLNVNNTNTVIAIYPVAGEGIGELRATWRISTRQAQTADEYGILIRNLLQTEGVDSKEISGVVIASVVPPVDWILRQFSERYFNHKPLFIEPGVKTGDSDSDRQSGRSGRRPREPTAWEPLSNTVGPASWWILGQRRISTSSRSKENFWGAPSLPA